MGEFDQTIGFTLMGVMINTYLTGVIMSQFFTYLNSKFNDSLWLKSMVAFLFIINITHAAAMVYMSWHYCVANFANPSIAPTGFWPYPFTSFTTAVLAVINQTYQAWRIYVFTQSKILVGFLVVAALATCGMGITVAIEGWNVHGIPKTKFIALQPVVEANLALQCVIDVIIAIILTIIFSRSKTSFGRTDEVLNRLIRIAIQSGFFTTVFALGTMLSFHFSPGTYMIALFTLPIGRIYTHTMMDGLITREQLRNLLANSGNSGNLVSFPQFTGGRETIMMRSNPSTKTGAKDPEALRELEEPKERRFFPLALAQVGGEIESN
ncbi:hypothetical protein FB451DRAFT_1555632 [Mycena latifolia]|nr:hypothetical protein FB451DRAFT_1555632 [Mycena latifolia]